MERSQLGFFLPLLEWKGLMCMYWHYMPALQEIATVYCFAVSGTLSTRGFFHVLGHTQTYNVVSDIFIR